MRKHVVWVALAQLLPLLAVGDGSNMARAANECRSGPGGPSPSGSHWYYRIDRATKRKCWYLGPLGQRSARASLARSSRRAAAAPVTPPPASDTALRDPNAESVAETTIQPRTVTSSAVAGPRRAPAANRAPIVARDQGSDERSTANEMPLVWPAPASTASDTAVGKTTVAAADPSVAAPAPAVAAPAPAVAAPAPAVATPAPAVAAPARPATAVAPAPSLAAPAPAVVAPARPAAAVVAASAAAIAGPVPAAAPTPAVAAPAPAAPTAAAPAEQSSMSLVKLFFIFAFVASSLALVGFLGRGLIDYVIARRANRRRAAEHARTEAVWTAPPPMPYMHAPHLADDFEPTPERPVQDPHGDWPRIARHSAVRGRVA